MDEFAIGFDKAELVHGFFDGHRSDMIGLIADHSTKLALLGEFHGHDAEAHAEDAVEREKPQKKEFLVLVSEPEGGLPKDLTGWVVQYPEDGDPRDVSDKILEVASTFNGSPKGKRVPVTSFGDACQSLPSKLLKERDVWVKTREPVRVIAVKNALGRRRSAD